MRVGGVTQRAEHVKSAKNKLSHLTITAPFTGKIIPVTDGDGNSTTYRVGQQISEGEVIGHMVDDSEMKLSLFSAPPISTRSRPGRRRPSLSPRR